MYVLYYVEPDLAFATSPGCCYGRSSLFNNNPSLAGWAIDSRSRFLQYETSDETRIPCFCRPVFNTHTNPNAERSCVVDGVERNLAVSTTGKNNHRLRRRGRSREKSSPTTKGDGRETRKTAMCAASKFNVKNCMKHSRIPS